MDAQSDNLLPQYPFSADSPISYSFKIIPEVPPPPPPELPCSLNPLCYGWAIGGSFMGLLVIAIAILLIAWIYTMCLNKYHHIPPRCRLYFESCLEKYVLEGIDLIKQKKMEEKKISTIHKSNPQQIEIKVEKIEENQNNQNNQNNKENEENKKESNEENKKESNEENKKESNKQNPPQRIISEEDYIKFQEYQAYDAWFKKLAPN